MRRPLNTVHRNSDGRTLFCYSRRYMFNHRRGTPQQLYSILVANMNRLSHLQLFGREHFEKRAYLKKCKMSILKIAPSNRA